MTLEKFTNIFIVVSLSFFLGLTVKREFFSKGSSKSVFAASFVGKEFPNFGILKFNEYQKTVVIIASSNCKFCQASSGLYRKIFELAASSSIVDAAVLYPSNEEKLEVVQSLAIPFDFPVIPVEFLRVGVQGTPTLLIVRPEGIVQKAWAGQLS
jgi:hypothetical protein